jgi:hypothetical protein
MLHVAVHSGCCVITIDLASGDQPGFIEPKLRQQGVLTHEHTIYGNRNYGVRCIVANTASAPGRCTTAQQTIEWLADLEILYGWKTFLDPRHTRFLQSAACN